VGGLIRSTSFKNLRRRPAARRVVRSHFYRHLIDINDILVRCTILRRDVRKRGAVMRALQHLVAIEAVVLFVVGVRIVLPTTSAEANAIQNATVNVLQMQADYSRALPELKMHDRTFALD
jgi:hypothetical protein